MTAGEDILLLGAQRLDDDWGKVVKLDSVNTATLLIEDMDLLAIETELGQDVRAAVRIHGGFPAPVWNQGDRVTLATGERLQILRPPVPNPGSPRWKAYGQILISKDA